MLCGYRGRWTYYLIIEYRLELLRLVCCFLIKRWVYLLRWQVLKYYQERKKKLWIQLFSRVLNRFSSKSKWRNKRNKLLRCIITNLHGMANIFSYDETVKLWDTRKMSKSLSTCEVGGGIWRIKWDPHKAEDILVAGMYSGFFWMNYNHENETVIHRDSFTEHASIAYGADICYLSSTEIERICSSYADRDQILNSNIRLTATCSFYDKKLCLCLLR